MNKAMMVNRLANTLLKREYEVLLSRGAFDIAAKRDKLMLIKSLTNIDGFNPQHATSLRTVSYFVSAHPFVVSMRTNRGFLTDDTIYSRFGIPVVTPKMFEDIIEDDAFAASSAKGRHTVEIDADALRKKRYEMKFTLEELGRLVGITKKSMYEIESERTNPTEKTVKKLERMLKIRLKKTYTPKEVEKSTMKANDALQARVSKELDRIGVENSPVHNTSFEIVGKESFSVITGLSKSTRKMKHTAMSVKRLSGIFGSSAFFVSKKSEEKLIEGVPVLREDELPSIESTKELKKLISETAG